MIGPRIRTLVFVAFAVVLATAQAFQWTPFEFPPGDQGYTIEIESAEGVAVLDVDIVDRGGSFDVNTVMRFDQEGVAAGDLGAAMFGGGGIGLFAFGPMMMFGPTAFLMPMILGNEDIAVRAEPIDAMGMGTVWMDREVEVAGRTCVVVRFEMAGGDDVEFALAEGLPVPCFSRFGTGRDAFEARLVEVR